MHSQVTDKSIVCKEFMQALEQCHSNLWAKYTGGCNDQKHELNMCLRKERLDRSAQNRQDAKLRSEKRKKALEKLLQYD